jgi:hypothetical protein
MPDDEEARDRLVLQWLAQLEDAAARSLTRLQVDEQDARAARDAAVKLASERASHVNPYLHGDVQSSALDALRRLEQARLEIDVATAPHEEIRRRIEDVLSLIKRVQSQRADVLVGEAQRWNVKWQRVGFLCAIASALVALASLIVAIIALGKHC